MVSVLTCDEEAAYREYVRRADGASLYHTLDWRALLSESIGGQSFYLIARQGGRVRGVMPLFCINSLAIGKRFVSLPFSHLVRTLADSPAVSTAMIEYAERLAREEACDYLEVKSDLPVEEGERWRKFAGECRSVLPLFRDETDQWNLMDGATRRGVRRALRSSVRIRAIGSRSDLYSAIHLLARARHRQGSPPHPNGFFIDLLNREFDGGEVWGMVADVAGVDVAAIITMRYRTSAVYAFGGSYGSEEQMRTRPNNLLFWEAIRRCAAEGCSELDFGTTPLGNTGLRRFKRGWGVEEVMHTTSFRVLGRKVPAKLRRDEGGFDSISMLLRRMPFPVFRAAGAVLFRQLG